MYKRVALLVVLVAFVNAFNVDYMEGYSVDKSSTAFQNVGSSEVQTREECLARCVALSVCNAAVFKTTGSCTLYVVDAPSWSTQDLIRTGKGNFLILDAHSAIRMTDFHNFAGDSVMAAVANKTRRISLFGACGTSCCDPELDVCTNNGGSPDCCAETDYCKNKDVCCTGGQKCAGNRDHSSSTCCAAASVCGQVAGNTTCCAPGTTCYLDPNLVNQRCCASTLVGSDPDNAANTLVCCDTQGTTATYVSMNSYTGATASTACCPPSMVCGAGAGAVCCGKNRPTCSEKDQECCAAANLCGTGLTRECCANDADEQCLGDMPSNQVCCQAAKQCGTSADNKVCCAADESCRPDNSGCCKSTEYCNGACCNADKVCSHVLGGGSDMCCEPAKKCGILTSEDCCDASEQCVGGNTASGKCCADANVCGKNTTFGVTCCTGPNKCMATGECCTAAKTCGTECCQAGFDCINGTCCATGTGCGGATIADQKCCSGNTTCHDSECCLPEKQCNSGVDADCCDASETCVNEPSGAACCPTAKAAATECCSTGFSAVDGLCCPDARTCGTGSSLACCSTSTTCLAAAEVCCSAAKTCGTGLDQACCTESEVCTSGKCIAPASSQTLRAGGFFVTKVLLGGNVYLTNGESTKLCILIDETDEKYEMAAGASITLSFTKVGTYNVFQAPCGSKRAVGDLLAVIIVYTVPQVSVSECKNKTEIFIGDTVIFNNTKTAAACISVDGSKIKINPKASATKVFNHVGCYDVTPCDQAHQHGHGKRAAAKAGGKGGKGDKHSSDDSDVKKPNTPPVPAPPAPVPCKICVNPLPSNIPAPTPRPRPAKAGGKGGKLMAEHENEVAHEETTTSNYNVLYMAGGSVLVGGFVAFFVAKKLRKADPERAPLL